jgi:hypothetical protein
MEPLLFFVILKSEGLTKPGLCVKIIVGEYFCIEKTAQRPLFILLYGLTGYKMIGSRWIQGKGDAA